MPVDAILNHSRRRQISLIHVLKKELGQGEAEYRNALKMLTGKESSALMDSKERSVVIDWLMQRRGSLLEPTKESALRQEVLP